MPYSAHSGKADYYSSAPLAGPLCRRRLTSLRYDIENRRVSKRRLFRQGFVVQILAASTESSAKGNLPSVISLICNSIVTHDRAYEACDERASE